METSPDTDSAPKSQKKTKLRKKSNISLLKAKIRHYDTKVRLLEESRKAITNPSNIMVKRSSSQPSPKKLQCYSAQPPIQKTERDSFYLNSLENISNESFDFFQKIKPSSSTSLKRRGNISFNQDLSKIKEKKKSNKENDSPNKIQILKAELLRVNEDNKMLKQHIKHTKESYQESLDAHKSHYEQEILQLKQLNKKLQDNSDYLRLKKEFEEKNDIEISEKEQELELKVKNIVSSIKADYERKAKSLNDHINDLKRKNDQLSKQIRSDDSKTIPEEPEYLFKPRKILCSKCKKNFSEKISR